MRYAVSLINEVLKRANDPASATDPAFFYLKARAFDAIAHDTPDLATEARELAHAAVQRAEALST